MRLNLFSSFFSKLSLSLILSFVLVGVMLLWLAQYLSQRYQHEVEQQLHHELAQHIVKDYPLLNQGVLDHGALKNAFHNMMVLGPDFEFYLLDAQGQIQTYSADPKLIKRSAVDLSAIETFLQGQQNFPIYGDDPRSQQGQKIFSVAPIFDEQSDTQQTLIKGYLYVIIGGQLYDGIRQLSASSRNLSLGLMSVGLILLLGLLVTLLIFFLLTRPLKRLTADIQRFHQNQFQNSFMPSQTWQPHSQDEVQQLGCAFNAMVAELGERYQQIKLSHEQRRQLVSYVSHDMRTPLSLLQGYLETWLLKYQNLTAEQHEELANTALKGAHQLSELVEQLLELAYLDGKAAEGETMPLAREPMSVSELAQDVAQLFKPRAESLGIEFSVICPPTCPQVMGNVAKLERVLTNLLENAFRHTGSTGKVVLRVEVKDDQVWVSVEDTGVGIATDELPHLFTQYYQARNSQLDVTLDRNRQAKARHSGLGLAICARVVQLHNSELQVSSQLGQGSTFRFALPAC